MWYTCVCYQVTACGAVQQQQELQASTRRGVPSRQHDAAVFATCRLDTCQLEPSSTLFAQLWTASAHMQFMYLCHTFCLMALVSVSAALHNVAHVACQCLLFFLARRNHRCRHGTVCNA